jgi:hypothetical protein
MDRRRRFGSTAWGIVTLSSVGRHDRHLQLPTAAPVFTVQPDSLGLVAAARRSR